MITKDVSSSIEKNNNQEKQSRWPLERKEKTKLSPTSVDDIRDEVTELREEGIEVEYKPHELSKKHSSSGYNGSFARRMVSRVVTKKRPDILIRKMINVTIKKAFSKSLTAEANKCSGNSRNIQAKKSFSKSLTAEANKYSGNSRNIEARQEDAVLDSRAKSNTKRTEIFITKSLKKTFINARNVSSKTFRNLAVPVEEDVEGSIGLVRDTEVTDTEVEDEISGTGEIEEYNTLIDPISTGIVPHVESPALLSSDVIHIGDESKTYLDDNDGKKEKKCEGCVIL